MIVLKDFLLIIIACLSAFTSGCLNQVADNKALMFGDYLPETVSELKVEYGGFTYELYDKEEMASTVNKLRAIPLYEDYYVNYEASVSGPRILTLKDLDDNIYIFTEIDDTITYFVNDNDPVSLGYISHDNAADTNTHAFIHTQILNDFLKGNEMMLVDGDHSTRLILFNKITESYSYTCTVDEPWEELKFVPEHPVEGILSEADLSSFDMITDNGIPVTSLSEDPGRHAIRLCREDTIYMYYYEY